MDTMRYRDNAAKMTKEERDDTETNARREFLQKSDDLLNVKTMLENGRMKSHGGTKESFTRWRNQLLMEAAELGREVDRLKIEHWEIAKINRAVDMTQNGDAESNAIILGLL